MITPAGARPGPRDFRFRLFWEVRERPLSYPSLAGRMTEEDRVRHFTLDEEDLRLLREIRSERGLLQMAVLLKTFRFLGYVPPRRDAVPAPVVERLAGQLGLDPALFLRGRRRGRRLWASHHLRFLRTLLGTVPWDDAKHGPTLEAAVLAVARQDPQPATMLAAAVGWCREQRVELPRRKELRRRLAALRRNLFETLCKTVSDGLGPQLREKLDSLLEVPEGARTTPYDWLKSPPGRPGIKTLRAEAAKLQSIQEIGHFERHLVGLPPSVLRELRRRGRPEDASQMRRHPEIRRMALLAVLLEFRRREVTDGLVQVLCDLVRRLEGRAERALDRDLVKNLPKVLGKGELLYRLVRAGLCDPETPVWDVLLRELGEEKIQRLIHEAMAGDNSYAILRTRKMHAKYAGHYRQMLKPVLEILEFRTTLPKYRPLIEALELVRRHVRSSGTWYPEEERIPEGVLHGAWSKTAVETGDGGARRVVRHLFELCCLKKLERGLRTREIWVEGSHRFRDPDQDLPPWDLAARVSAVGRLGLPENAGEFVDQMDQRLTAALQEAEKFFAGAGPDVEIRHPGGGERGYFHVPPLGRIPERPLLQQIKEGVLARWGVRDLLEILLEAERLVEFSRFFQTSGQRQVLDRESARARLLLVLYGLGTNLGLRRIHAAAKPGCTYDDLRYFRSRFVTAEALRFATAAIVNRTLELRNPEIWGRGTACVSDGKQLQAWDQNLVTDWNPHYGTRGVMAYWHVDTQALCIYSQLQAHRASEVAAMLRGLIRHETEMRVAANYVDSRGQSEVAFAFCELRQIALRPRLKGIRRERLYLPVGGSQGRWPSLAGVTTRPIRWQHVLDEYGEMLRYVVAVSEETGPIDSILRRLSSANGTHRTYKAFAELGKALKTIWLCSYLTRASLRREVHDALNVVENWNSCLDFVFFGRASEIQTNDPEQQELAVLALHLLMSSLVLVNTVMVERVLLQTDLLAKLEQRDREALTPLFTSNVNPYGDFDLDLGRPSFLEAA